MMKAAGLAGGFVCGQTLNFGTLGRNAHWTSQCRQRSCTLPAKRGPNGPSRRAGHQARRERGEITTARTRNGLGRWIGPRWIFPVELFINALIAGILLGGFYAAVTVGISISFGILDIVNIAHPAFIILGSYIAYIVNQRLGVDPILTASSCCRPSTRSAPRSIEVYYQSFEKRGQEALRGLAFFFGLLFVTEVLLILVFGVDYRYVQADYIGPTSASRRLDLPLRMLVPFGSRCS